MRDLVLLGLETVCPRYPAARRRAELHLETGHHLQEVEGRKTDPVSPVLAGRVVPEPHGHGEQVECQLSLVDQPGDELADVVGGGGDRGLIGGEGIEQLGCLFLEGQGARSRGADDGDPPLGEAR